MALDRYPHATTTVHLDELRVPAALMLATAVVLPALPGHPGIPCPLRTLTGIPCPLCGMTTSVTAAVHLHLGRALTANPAGVAAVAVALVVLALPRLRQVMVPSWLAPAVLALMWAYQLVRFRLL